LFRCAAKPEISKTAAPLISPTSSPDDEPPPNVPLSRVVLMMILRRQGFANIMRDLLATAFAAVDSRVGNVTTRFVKLVEGGVIRLAEMFVILVSSHLAPRLVIEPRKAGFALRRHLDCNKRRDDRDLLE
jgi:hypothetical protein